MKNTSTSHMSFELNCSYYFYDLYKENIHYWLSADKLATKLKNLIIVGRKILQYAQELEKQYYDKGIK